MFGRAFAMAPASAPARALPKEGSVRAVFSGKQRNRSYFEEATIYTYFGAPPEEP